MSSLLLYLNNRDLKNCGVQKASLSSGLKRPRPEISQKFHNAVQATSPAYLPRPPGQRSKTHSGAFR